MTSPPPFRLDAAQSVREWRPMTTLDTDWARQNPSLISVMLPSQDEGTANQRRACDPS